MSTSQIELSEHVKALIGGVRAAQRKYKRAYVKSVRAFEESVATSSANADSRNAAESAMWCARDTLHDCCVHALGLDPGADAAAAMADLLDDLEWGCLVDHPHIFDEMVKIIVTCHPRG